MFLLRTPGMYRVDSDTSLVIDVPQKGGCAAGRRVLDLGTGTGALALAAAWCGAASVTAVDPSLRPVAAMLRTVPFGPVMRPRAAMLAVRGSVETGKRTEQLVVIAGRRGR